MVALVGSSRRRFALFAPLPTDPSIRLDAFRCRGCCDYLVILPISYGAGASS